MILKQGAGGLEILLIERATNEKDHWSGHIGFPGGRVDLADYSPRRTAERETMEELGVDLASARLLGRLGDTIPGGLPMVVSCFVYGLERSPHLIPDGDEVAQAFWLPMHEIKNPARCATVKPLIRSRTKTFPALSITEWAPQPLWGLSFRLLRKLDKILYPAQPRWKEPGICLDAQGE
jgi:8-oxo-dGTP pyrophosphatase MutT (NUDIX family)